MFRKEEIEKLLSEYDCLTSRLLTLDFHIITDFPTITMCGIWT